MPTRRAFLDAIAAAPDADMPRLLYADWLEENGEGRRAEFIRAQCELARLSEADPHRPELRRRVSHLFDGAWEPTRQGVRGWRRGFPWWWRATAAELLAAFEPDACEVGFETSLDLTHHSRLWEPPEDWAERLAASPRTALVRRFVNDRNCVLRPGEFATLVRSRFVSGLRVIELSLARVGLAGVRGLCESPAAPRLTRLALWDCFGPQRDADEAGEVVRLIATHPALARLESLVLVANGLGEPALRELLASPTLSSSLKLEFREASWRVPAELAAGLLRRFESRSRIV